MIINHVILNLESSYLMKSFLIFGIWHIFIEKFLNEYDIQRMVCYTLKRFDNINIKALYIIN